MFINGIQWKADIPVTNETHQWSIYKREKVLTGCLLSDEATVGQEALAAINARLIHWSAFVFLEEKKKKEWTSEMHIWGARTVELHEISQFKRAQKVG